VIAVEDYRAGVRRRREVGQGGQRGVVELERVAAAAAAVDVGGAGPAGDVEGVAARSASQVGHEDPGQGHVGPAGDGQLGGGQSEVGVVCRDHLRGRVAAAGQAAGAGPAADVE